MSDVSWLDEFLDDTINIQINDNNLIVNFLRNLFVKPESFFTSSELDDNLNELTELKSVSIISHEIYYLANRYDHHNSSYYRSVCLRLLAIRCFMLLFEEIRNDVDIQQLDLNMNWYTAVYQYIFESTNLICLLPSFNITLKQLNASNRRQIE